VTHGNTFRNHAAKADVHRVKVGRRYWLFTFSDQWGPLLTDEWGEPVDNTPLADEAHPFWDAFEAWQAASKIRGTDHE
jgi:hypothetical protein